MGRPNARIARDMLHVVTIRHHPRECHDAIRRLAEWDGRLLARAVWGCIGGVHSASVVVEVDYWVRKYLGSGVLVAWLDDVAAGAFQVVDLQPADYRRVRELCDRYADADIGFVDAAVLAIVERLGEHKLATLDRRHFGLLRPRHVEALTLLPE